MQVNYSLVVGSRVTVTLIAERRSEVIEGTVETVAPYLRVRRLDGSGPVGIDWRLIRRVKAVA